MTRMETIIRLHEDFGCSLDLCKKAYDFAEGRDGEPLLLMIAFLKSEVLAVAIQYKTEDRAMWFYEKMRESEVW